MKHAASRKHIVQKSVTLIEGKKKIAHLHFVSYALNSMSSEKKYRPVQQYKQFVLFLL